MAGVTNFEELKCWQKGRDLVNFVYSITNNGSIARDFAFKDQIRRAALSVTNNIAEGFGRESNKEFLRFLEISYASCTEVKSMSYIMEDLKYLSVESVLVLHSKVDETKGLIRGLMKYLRTNLAH